MRKVAMSIVGVVFLSVQLGLAVVRVPFELDRIYGFILVRVSVNGQPPQWFQFDTGGYFAVALTYKSAIEMGFTPDPEKKMRLRTGTVSEAYDVTIESIRIVDGTGKVVYTATSTAPSIIMTEASVPPAFALHDRLIVPAGVIGTRAFEGKVVTISYDTRELLIADVVNSNGWEKVTLDKNISTELPSYDYHPSVAIVIGDRTVPVVVDSGDYISLILRDELLPFLSQYIYTGSHAQSLLSSRVRIFSARGLPEVKLAGKYPLPLEGVAVRTKSEQEIPNVLGSIAMLRFNWQFDFRQERVEVYLQPRRPVPEPRLWLPLNLELVFREGKVFISAARRSAPRQAGVERDCLLLSVNGVSVSADSLVVDPMTLLKAVDGLLRDPFAEKVRVRVRCGDETREVEFIRLDFDWVADIDRHRLLKKFGTNDRDEFVISFSDEYDVVYFKSGKEVKLANTELVVCRVDGSDVKDMTIEALFRYLHSRLTEGRSVELSCVDELGEEVLVRIPGFKSGMGVRDGEAGE